MSLIDDETSFVRYKLHPDVRKAEDRFFEEIPLMGMQILIPEQVINEVKKLKSQNVELALKLLQKNEFKKIDIGSGHVDKSIIKFAKQHPDIVVATLDRELKKKLKNQKLIIRGKKKLEIQ